MPGGARPDDEYQPDDQYVKREGDQHVDDAHHDGIEPAAAIAGQRPDNRAETKRENDGQDAYPQVSPGRPDQSRELVAPELVGTEEVFGRKAAQYVVEVLVVGLVRAYERGEHCHQHQRQRDGAAGYQRRAVPRPVGQDERGRLPATATGTPPGAGGGPSRPERVVIAT